MWSKCSAALVLAAIFALQATPSNAQSAIGKAQNVKPQADGSVGGTLAPGANVHENETIRTGTAGLATLRFLDDTNLSVGPTSVVHLDKFVYDPNKKGAGTITLEVTKGAFRFVTGTQNKGEFKIKTPYGTLGVRG